jgi:uncharacterized protein (DUF302 family)
MNRTQDASPALAASNYGFQRVLQDLSFGQAVAVMTEALKTEGFGILADIDVQATMKAKRRVDERGFMNDPWDA